MKIFNFMIVVPMVASIEFPTYKEDAQRMFFGGDEFHPGTFRIVTSPFV